MKWNDIHLTKKERERKSEMEKFYAKYAPKPVRKYVENGQVITVYEGFNSDGNRA